MDVFSNLEYNKISLMTVDVSDISDYDGDKKMTKGERAIVKLRAQLIKELNQEVEDRFQGNKTSASEVAKVPRSQFTGICNGTERVGIEKLIEIGTNLGWDIDLQISRR